MCHRLPVSRFRASMGAPSIRDVVSRAAALERSGKKVIHLEIGRPDYDSPASAKEAVKRALDAGQVHYTDTAGTIELRRAVAEAVARDRGIEADPESVVITLGAAEALVSTFMALLEPGDEVVVPAPFFPSYAPQVAMAGGVLREARCRFENGFRLSLPDLEAAVTERTRIILINTPGNPAGTVLSRSELEGIAELAKRRGLLVVSDECYEKFVYDGAEHLSIASLPGMVERTVIISAASKTFSMTGWRVGWLVAPPELRPYVLKAHQLMTSCAASFAQAGVAEALTSADGDVRRMIAGYDERRRFFADALGGLDGFEVHVPKGAFYVFPRVSKLARRMGMTTAELAAWLLDEAGVASVPGDAFYAEPCGESFLRLAYCRPLAELREAVERIRAAIAKRR
ncbi:MAG: pyridoxal phosphate-dependent aminotransferase [Synergistaceae bacterium]|jgi:aspartate aminotransferase/aminotransferase|nr:pyridoxal phosphate-dependent aminotransferase [Synergistaceae bacterium]